MSGVTEGRMYDTWLFVINPVEYIFYVSMYFVYEKWNTLTWDKHSYDLNKYLFKQIKEFIFLKHIHTKLE